MKNVKKNILGNLKELLPHHQIEHQNRPIIALQIDFCD